MFTVDIQLYLRRATIRKLNRKRKRGKKLSFRSKMTIAKEMLKTIAPLLSKDYQVYVLLDSWYASARSGTANRSGVLFVGSSPTTVFICIEPGVHAG